MYLKPGPNFRLCAAKFPTEKNPEKGAETCIAPRSREWAGWPRDFMFYGYRRSDALEKRRKLMEAWAAYCDPSDASNIVQLANRRRLSGSDLAN